MPGAAAPARGTAGVHPRIGRLAARRFSGHSALATDPDLRVYLGDMVIPHGFTLREDLLEQGVGHTYGEMGEQLLREVVHEDDPIDMLILAYAIHDVRPGQSTAMYLNQLLPNRPMAFTVCDQGIAGPYTAVRIASEYLRSGDNVRALIIVAEQDALHYEPPAQLDIPRALPEGHGAVAVLFEGVGTAGVSSVREVPSVAPDDVRDLFRAQLTHEAVSGRGVLILGNGLSKDDGDGLGFDDVIAAPAGEPCTGVWHELAQGYPAWAQDGAQITLADYDRQLRTLCLCTIETHAADTATPR